MKKLRIGRRRKGDGLSLSPLELALYPALADGRWQVPDHFNFTRDVVEGLAEDPKRRAVTFIGKDGIIEPRTFHVVAERAARWSWLLRERGVRPGDSVLVLAGTNIDWIEIVLACIKVGAVVVPGPPTLSAETLDVRLERTGADLVVAERSAEPEIERTTNRPLVLYIDDGRTLLEDTEEEAPTHDSSSRDIAFVLETPGTSGNAKLVGHSHGAVFGARVAAEVWLDAGRGDAVWCPAEPGSAASIWHMLVGPWSRGAEMLVHDGPFDPLERLDLVYRLGVTVLCQTPAEYEALSKLRELGRFRPPQLRRLVSTGEWLDPTVTAIFEETWGLTIHDGYGQAETNIVVANSAEAGFKPGSLGLPLPGHQVAVVDDQGNELPPNTEGELAVRGRPPTLFAGYWESPEQTKAAFRGDWYATGDIATVDEDGFFWFVGRGADVITSRGARFGPYEAEHALRAHKAVAASAVVGVRDLERGGQFVRAFVVLDPLRATASDQLEAELRHELGQTLPEHEVPREIEFVDELPTAPGGKVRRLELRERLVVGRPLWDLPPAAEPEHDPWGGMLDPWPSQAEAEPAPAAADPEPASEPVPLESENGLPTSEALPDYIVPPPAPEPPRVAPEPEPEPEPVAEAAPQLEPEPELPVAPVPAPVPEPEPPPVAPAPEPAPQPLADVLPGPETEPGPPSPLTEPEPIVEPERDLPTDPVPEPEPPPDLVPPLPPEPEPDLAAEAEPEIEPVAFVEPQVEPEPVVEEAAEPEQAAAPEPEPEPGPFPKDVWVPVITERTVTEPVPEPVPEPEPEPEPEPVPEPEPPAAEAEPDYIVEPAEETTPPAPKLPPDTTSYEARPRVTAEEILNPEPPPGPLPDFIVDPQTHAPEEPPARRSLPSFRTSRSSTPAVEPDTPRVPADPVPEEVPRASLGLPPLTDFPSAPVIRPPDDPPAFRSADEDEDGEESTTRSGGRRSSPEPSKRGRRERSAGEPGDMSEGVDWAGLSSRLSAYSLGKDAQPDPAADDDEPKQDREDSES